jgi:hypothetical protein
MLGWPSQSSLGMLSEPLNYATGLPTSIDCPRHLRGLQTVELIETFDAGNFHLRT